jgi:hypothetical protein
MADAVSGKPLVGFTPQSLTSECAMPNQRGRSRFDEAVSHSSAV